MSYIPSFTADVASPESADRPQRSRWGWSIKSLLAITALVAVYFGGRASTDPNFGAPDAGTWQLNMPVGAQRPVTLLSLGPGQFFLRGTTAIDGQYRWKGRRLTVEAPDDKRMTGYAWGWDGDDLVLVAENPTRPNGATYVGTRMKFISPDASKATQSMVAIVNSGQRPAIRQPSQRTRIANIPTELADLAGFVADSWRPPPLGLWEINVRPTSTTLKVRLVSASEGGYELIGAGAFSGVYAIENDQLVVKAPDDKRMVGMAWAWKNGDLILITEPASRPTGASYLGARMRYVGPDEKPSW